MTRLKMVKKTKKEMRQMSIWKEMHVGTLTEANTTKIQKDAHVIIRLILPFVPTTTVHPCQIRFSKFITLLTVEGIDSYLDSSYRFILFVNVPIFVSHRDSRYHFNNPSPHFSLVTQTSQIHLVTTTTTTNPSTTPPLIPDFASLFSFDQRVTRLESDLSKLKQSNPFFFSAKSISLFPGIVDEYLGSKMNKAVDVAIQLKSDKIREEAQVENLEFLNSLESKCRKIIKVQSKLSHSKITSKRQAMIKIKMKNPLMDQTKGPRDGDYARKMSHLKNQLVMMMFILLERHKMNVSDTLQPLQTPDVNGTQSSFNEFMATPIDFSAFMINRPKIDHLTQELLTGPTYDLIKGTYKSVAELDYHLEEVFKATNEQLDGLISKECLSP
ncbi:hypothetical protein Tco_1438754 [Tanacetum coccineum]